MKKFFLMLLYLLIFAPQIYGAACPSLLLTSYNSETAIAKWLAENNVNTAGAGDRRSVARLIAESIQTIIKEHDGSIEDFFRAEVAGGPMMRTPEDNAAMTIRDQYLSYLKNLPTPNSLEITDAEIELYVRDSKAESRGIGNEALLIRDIKNTVTEINQKFAGDIDAYYRKQTADLLRRGPMMNAPEQGQRNAIVREFLNSLRKPQEAKSAPARGQQRNVATVNQNDVIKYIRATDAERRGIGNEEDLVRDIMVALGEIKTRFNGNIAAYVSKRNADEIASGLVLKTPEQSSRDAVLEEYLDSLLGK